MPEDKISTRGFPGGPAFPGGVSMEAGVSPARQARARHRHELRTLTYVTLDQANGGIVRNLTHDGMGVQVVAAVRAQQQLRVRFELRYPRLRVETRGEVIWATSSGQCGIRFLDLSPRMTRQINEWIFGNLLEGIPQHLERSGSMFAKATSAEATSAKLMRQPARMEEFPGYGNSVVPEAGEDDGLIVSPKPLKVIELPTQPGPRESVLEARTTPRQASIPLDWLSQPLSARGLAWTVDMLAVVAGLLLFALVFLAVTGEAPRWPLAMIGGATFLVAAMYWGFFQMFGGASLGSRLARLAEGNREDDREAVGARFR